MLWSFVPIAALLTLTPGPATALVLRSALTDGGRAAVWVVLGNGIGVMAWAVLSAAGVSALVAASEAAFVGLKVASAVVLVGLGLQALWRARRSEAPVEPAPRSRPRTPARALRDGLATSLANPKLAVFFVSLFPHFVPAGAPVLGATLLMAALVVGFDLLWYGSLGFAVARAKRSFLRTSVARRLEQLTGAILIALGLRLAFDDRP